MQKLNVHQIWNLGNVHSELSKTDLSNEATKYLVDHWKIRHGEKDFEGSASKELENLYVESMNLVKHAIMITESKIQTFRLYQLIGDIMPKLIMASSVTIILYLGDLKSVLFDPKFVFGNNLYFQAGSNPQGVIL